MRLISVELLGFKSFARKATLEFSTAVTAVVGPNGSGKSNIAESFRFALGEQSMKSMRGRKGEDMIWNGSQSVPRSGRASVKLTFDNTDRALGMAFDQVVIERVVHRDGVNEYLLNNSSVRLKDITEMLSKVNIGSSGHHIISQGEADRVLTATPKERRAMLEDALGLTSFLYKRAEAEKKLEKTAENMREVELMRRELAPHLKFLTGQVRKIEDGERLRTQASELYLEYLRREHVYLTIRRAMLEAAHQGPAQELADLSRRLEELQETGSVALTKRDTALEDELSRLEHERTQISHERDSQTRELGRVEGELSAHERMSHVVHGAVPHTQAEHFAKSIEQSFAESDADSLEALRARVERVVEAVRDFLMTITGPQIDPEPPADVVTHKQEVEAALAALGERETSVNQSLDVARAKIAQERQREKDSTREAQQELMSLMSRRGSLESEVVRLRSQKEMLESEHESFRRELGEAGALIGFAATGYEGHVLHNEKGEVVADSEIADEDRGAQSERRRKLERLKIRLEEAGLGNTSEIMKEFTDTSERDQFLARELADLEESAQKLRSLIAELVQTLAERFTEGIEKVNTQFDAYCKLMFNGGSASLAFVDESSGVPDDLHQDGVQALSREEKTPEQGQGVEVSVSLPNKRVKGLHMLSGGERSLVSIALIFAMSQINPPPFLILDETDAALDEANSRRYGDMIERLAEHSQLILITHNRETMSRAGVLYGVTMVGDGVSKLLSVKFEDALAVAK